MKEEHKSNRWSMLRRDHDGQSDPISRDISNSSDVNINSSQAVPAANPTSSAQIARSSDPNQLKNMADVVTATLGSTPPPKSIPPSELSNENSENSGEDNTKIKKFVRKFFSKFKENEEEPINPNKNLIFGTDLEASLKIASATISVTSADPDSFVEYGEIPIVVAKCGLFLKNNGLLVEGIFRVGGSSKRVRNLQYLFSQPPDFGRKLSWDGYNVHDAASLLRRFLNSMTEPVIPLELYEAFREPLRKRPQIIQYLTYRDPNNSMSAPPSSLNTSAGHTASVVKNPPVNLDSITSDIDDNSSSIAPANKNSNITHTSTAISSTTASALSTNTNPASLSVASNENNSNEKKKHRHRKKSHKRFVKNIDSASKEYEQLVAQLPKQRKQLLLYILDLLDLFSQHSSENRMSTANLSAVFQPSVLAHPKHYLAPEEYILSQRVVEFLIEYSYKLLPRITGISKTPSFNKSLLSTSASNTANIKDSSSLPPRPQNLKHTSMTNVRASIPLSSNNNTKPDDLTTKRRSINVVSSEKAPTSELPKVQSTEKRASLSIPQHTRKHSKSMSAADESSTDLITNKNSSLNYYDETPVVANEDVVDNIVSESGDNTD